MITEKEQSIISSTKKFKHRFDRTENFLKIIMKQILFSFNRVFNYIKIQYAKDNAMIMMIIKNLQFFDSSFYWNYIENHDVEIVIATYWMLFNFKKIFYRIKIVKILKTMKCFLKKKNNFRAFMMRFQKNLIIKNNDFLKLMSLQNVFETSIQQTQSTSLTY